MSLGPFDSRVKRSRCVACSLSHLKVSPVLSSCNSRRLTRRCLQCTGSEPCSNCKRRSISCVFGATTQRRAGIQLDNANHKTSANFVTKRALILPKPRGALVASRNTARHLYYFDIFIQRNAFGGGRDDYGVDVRNLMGTKNSQFLVSAVTALGALQSSTLGHGSESERRHDQCAALKAYSDSIMSLHAAMTRDVQVTRLQVMWATLLLGLFEVLPLPCLGLESRPFK